MKKNNQIPFSALKRLLLDLGFAERRSKSAWIFNHAKEGLVVFRLYKEDEPVDVGDLISTRKFLDFRGILEGKDFDASLQQSAPA